MIECTSDFQADVRGAHLLLVIDQREARIYGTELVGSPRRSDHPNNENNDLLAFLVADGKIMCGGAVNLKVATQ